MRAALKRSGLAPTDIDYVSAHATPRRAAMAKKRRDRGGFCENKSQPARERGEIHDGHLLGGPEPWDFWRRCWRFATESCRPRSTWKMSIRVRGDGAQLHRQCRRAQTRAGGSGEQFGFGGTNASLVVANL